MAEYVIENLSQLHHRLTRGLPSEEAERAYRFAETTLLVSLTALRDGYRELLNGPNVDPASEDGVRPSDPPGSPDEGDSSR